ncbi:agmatinase [Leucobacter exalbidus]|uniref:Agmatinase n=1 Tax=Leucobacter exalbidus TaxID=662960 RepID=A0A940T3T4_9MICO|nr:agmatinase [Leucobacter exalbidus]MBP1326492.1 agmatinase [Leucobacter exalbidus]
MSPLPEHSSLQTPAGEQILTQIDFAATPRYASAPTFAGLPRLDQVSEYQVGVIGIPFDSAVTFRPGARFGPEAIRGASRLLRPYHVEMDAYPFAGHQVADLGNIPVTPFSIESAVASMVRGLDEASERSQRLVLLGGDHTIAYPSLKSLHRLHGPIAVVHFDAHLDTWGPYFGANLHHGAPFRRAFEDGLLDPEGCMHVGVRGSVYGPEDNLEDDATGFQRIRASEFIGTGIDGIVEQIRARVGDRPLYISVDIDVLDPAFAPGTGTPEPGGLSSRELLHMLRGLKGLNLVGADVVEVAPAYDHADVTALAAAHVAYEYMCLWAQ